MELELGMPGYTFVPGSLCSLDLNIRNKGPDYPGAQVFVALNVGTDDYWFYPNWKQYPGEVDWKTMSIGTLSETTESILSAFTWPSGVGEYFNSSFITAVVSASGELISNVDIYPFGWSTGPRIDTIDPVFGPPGSALRIEGKGFKLSSDSIRVQVGGYDLPVISKESGETDSVLTCIPVLDPGVYDLSLIVDDLVSNTVQITIEDMASTGKPLGQVMTEISQGVNELTTIMKSNILPDAVAKGIIDSADLQVLTETMDRADNMFNVAYNDFQNFDQDDKEVLESLIALHGLDDIFLQLAESARHYQKKGPGDIAASELAIYLDVTSMCLSLADSAWSLIDAAAIVYTGDTLGEGTPAAAVSLIIHFSIKMIDHVIDGGVRTDLSDIAFNGNSTQTIELYYNYQSDFVITGSFEHQESICVATFEVLFDTITTVLPGAEEWNGEIEEYVQSLLLSIDIELTEWFMGESFAGMEQRPPLVVPLALDIFEGEFDLTNLIGNSFFFACVSPLMGIISHFQFPTAFACQTGVDPWESGVFEWDFNSETFSITPVDPDVSISKIDFKWYVFKPHSQWWLPLFSGLEIPETQKKVVPLIISHDTPPTNTPSGPTFTPAPPTSTPTSELVTATPTLSPVPTGFVFISPGGFKMGSPLDEPCRETNETQHEVTITRGFYMMRTEVTRQMWADLKAVQPTLPDDPSDTHDSFTMNHPVQNNTWLEAVLFSNLMSVQTGYTRCYYKDAGFSIPVDSTNYMSGTFYCNFNANGYRLPTESEWEYACRGGTTGAFSCDEPDYHSWNCHNCAPGTNPVLEDYCVFCANDPGGIAVVGSKLPNPNGLYDIHGNVWECCWDWYGTYPSDTVTDPTGPTSGSFRVMRSGAFYYYARGCRSAYRNYFSQSLRDSIQGFRLVRTQDTAPTPTATSTPAGPTPTPFPVSTGFVFISPGIFNVGSPPDEPCRDSDETQHQVILTRGYQMMQTEVTRQMWADLKAAQPTLPNDPSDTSASPTMNHPVQNNTWYEAVLFSNLMSVQYGYELCYYNDSHFAVPIDSTNYTSGMVFCDFQANGYRLPTESEWEYACRGCTTSAFSCNEPSYTSGSCSSCTSGTHPVLEDYCVYCANAPGGTEVLGSKLPNPYGLFDIHGNVFEWCWDLYGTYPVGSATDPTGAISGSNRVCRGGGWSSDPRLCRSALRNNSAPNVRSNSKGFRLLRFAP